MGLHNLTNYDEKYLSPMSFLLLFGFTFLFFVLNWEHMEEKIKHISTESGDSFRF